MRTVKKIDRVLLLCLLISTGPSHAESMGSKIADKTYEWAKSLLERFRNNGEHTNKRIQGKEILKLEEATNDDQHPMEHPSEWDYIESDKQKCWFHKRTRKKVCEGKTK